MSACSLAACGGSQPVAPARVAQATPAVKQETSGSEGGLGQFTTVRTRAVEARGLNEKPVDLRLALEKGRRRSGKGRMDTRRVSNAVGLRLRKIRSCWARAVHRNSSLSGKVTVAFSIQPSGKVRGVRALRNGTGSATVARCVRRGLAKMMFTPGPVGGAVSYEYAFVLAPGST